MKAILALILSSLVLTTAHAQHCCPRNFYVRFLSGPNFLQDTTTDGNHTTFDTGYLIAGSVGYCLPCNLRLEGEYTFRRNAIKQIDFYVEGFSNNGDFQSSSYMGNLFWDLCPCWCIQPYVGLGAGYDFQHMRACNSRILFAQDWDSFSWQVMAGLTYPIYCGTEISLEYRFHQGSSHFYSHSIGIGLGDRF